MYIKNKLNIELYINLVALLPRYALSLTVGKNKHNSALWLTNNIDCSLYNLCLTLLSCNFTYWLIVYMSIYLQVG